MKQLIIIPILLFALLAGGILIGVNISQPEEPQEITFNEEYNLGLNDNVKSNSLHAEDCDTTGEFEGVIVAIYQPEPSICTVELENGSKRVCNMYYLEKV